MRAFQLLLLAGGAMLFAGVSLLLLPFPTHRTPGVPVPSPWGLVGVPLVALGFAFLTWGWREKKAQLGAGPFRRPDDVVLFRNR